VTVLLFLDTETTGTEPVIHEVIEIGAVLGSITFHDDPPGLVSWREFGSLDYKIRPQHIETADPDALRINGYNPDGWTGAAEPRVALQALDNLLARGGERVMLAGHNVQFDYDFMRMCYQKAEMKWPICFGYRRLDTMSLSAPLWLRGLTSNGSASLDAVAACLGIPRPTPHRAYDDAIAARDVALFMMAQHLAAANAVPLPPTPPTRPSISL
jgi:DNA polymerase-3 subunit epsilon